MLPTWAQWQREVTKLLSRELAEALRQVCLEDVDWDAWEHYFQAGYSPQAAVDRAFERAL